MKVKTATQLPDLLREAVVTEMYNRIDTLKNEGASEVEILAYKAGMNRALLVVTTTLNNTVII